MLKGQFKRTKKDKRTKGQKENLRKKIFFQIMLHEVLKGCKKLYLLMKPDVKQQQIKELIAVSYNFFKKHLQNLK